MAHSTDSSSTPTPETPGAETAPNDREAILRRVREALDPLPQRAAYPEWPRELATSRQGAIMEEGWPRFAHHLSSIHGSPLENWDEFRVFIADQKLVHGYCDPELQPLVKEELGDSVTLVTEIDRGDIDACQFGITRASGAIAESGSLILTDRETSDRLAALTPWVHICLFNPANLYADLSTALEHFGDDPSIIWATGPSKTADVEGILIEGVHGPGLQAALMDERVPASQY